MKTDNQQLQASRKQLRQASDDHTTELKANGERFALALQGSNDGVWDWNLETNEVYYSARWKSMLGYQDDELANRLDTWLDLVHADDRERVLATAESYLSGEVDAYKSEMRMQHKDGHMVYVLARGYGVFR